MPFVTGIPLHRTRPSPSPRTPAHWVEGQTKGVGRATHLPPPSASTRSSPPKSSDTASSTSGLVESRQSSSSSRHDAASQLAPASQLAAAAGCGQAYRTSRSARPAEWVGTRAERRGKGAPCEAGGAALCCGLCDAWSRPKRACIRGWRCVRAAFACQAEHVYWMAAADNGKEAHNWVLPLGRQGSPPSPPTRHFFPASRRARRSPSGFQATHRLPDPQNASAGSGVAHLQRPA